MGIPWWAWVLLALWMAPGAAVALRAFRRSLTPIAIGTLPEEGEPPYQRPRWERPLLLLILPIPLAFFLVMLLVFALLYPAVCAIQAAWYGAVGDRHAP